ncbi:hypothetical protein [Nocardia sp. NPDC057353]|uniref:TPR repeat region-containing protein n=1 Tax=Nocardia sp. NPDC057353 TaxID=3346104 RepID=UPI003630F41A
MPTRTDIIAWKPEKLSEWAAEMEADTGYYQAQLGRVLTHFGGAGWSGRAADAASDRFVEEHDQGRKLAQEIIDVATALRAADQRLADEKRLLLAAVGDVEADPALRVADDWVVSVVAGAVDEVTVAAHQEVVHAAYRSLTGAISEIEVAITAATQKIRVRGDQLGDGVDAPDAAPADSGGLGSEDGRAVREAIRPDGTIDTEALDEISTRLPPQALTQSELDTLAAGGEVDTMPASVQQYYREFYQSAGKDGILALNDQLKAQEQAGNPLAAPRRDALANGLMAVSNENLGTGRNPDGTLRSPGSYQQLPEDLRRTISTRVGGPDANADRFPTSPPETDLAAQHRFLDDSSRLGELLKQSNPGYEPGVELSRELTRQAAALGSPGANNDTADLPGGTIPLDSLEPTMRDFLEVSSRNQEAMTQLLTGGTEPGSPPLEDGYDPKKVFQPLLHYDWTDSDGAEPPKLFEWIGEDAVPRAAEPGDPGVTPEQSERAGRAASGLAELLTGSSQDDDHIGPFEALMNMPGSDDESLGIVNPGLTQQLTGAMIPYLDALALSPTDQTSGFELQGDRNLDAVRLSTLFNTDPVSSAAWNAAIVDRTNDYAAQFATESNQPSNNRDALANAAGRLLGFQEQGLRAEAFDRGLNEEEAEKESAEKKQLGVDIAASVLSGGVGEKVPVAGIFLDVAGQVISDSIEPKDVEIQAQQTSVDYNDLSTQRHYAMLQALAEQNSGFFDTPPDGTLPVPSSWIQDGRLMSYEQIVGVDADDRPRAMVDLQSTAAGWLEASNVNVAAFQGAINFHNDNLQEFTFSRDDYLSRVLKG